MPNAARHTPPRSKRHSQDSLEMAEAAQEMLIRAETKTVEATERLQVRRQDRRLSLFVMFDLSCFNGLVVIRN